VVRHEIPARATAWVGPPSTSSNFTARTEQVLMAEVISIERVPDIATRKGSQLRPTITLRRLLPVENAGTDNRTPALFQ